MSYFVDEIDYNPRLLKSIIIREGHDSPTKYLQDLFIMEYTSANKKLNRDCWHRKDMQMLRKDLNMDTDEFMRVFFPD